MIRWNGIEIDRKNRTIRRGDAVLQFNKQDGRNLIFEMICHLILSRPLTHAELFHRLYGDREDGGPLCESIKVRLCQYRHKLEKLGLVLNDFNGRNYPRRPYLTVESR